MATKIMMSKNLNKKPLETMKKILISLVGSLLITSHVWASCIAVVTAGGGQQFWKDVKSGAIRAGEVLGVKVYVRGAIDEINTEGQKHLINVLMAQDCQGLVLAPNSLDRKRDVTLLKRQGIPTVFVDRDIGGDRISVIKTNNFVAGEQAGKEMVKVLRGQGSVAVFRSSRNIVTTTAREEGFIKAVTEGGLKVIADDYLGTRIGEIRRKAFEVLREKPQIKGVFTPNEVTSVGTWAALTRLNKVGEVIHIGFDANKNTLKAVRNQQMHGLIVQNPYQMGYLAVWTLFQILQGQEVDDTIHTSVLFINQNNIKVLSADYGIPQDND